MNQALYLVTREVPMMDRSEFKYERITTPRPSWTDIPRLYLRRALPRMWKGETMVYKGVVIIRTRKDRKAYFIGDDFYTLEGTIRQVEKLIGEGK